MNGADPVGTKLAAVRGRAATIGRRLAKRANVRIQRADWDPWDHRRQIHLSEAGTTVVLDGGAHIGEYGQALRRNGYRGRIVSFEPVRRFRNALLKVAAEDALWYVQPYALGAVSGSSDITVHAESSGFSSLLPLKSWVPNTFPEAHIVDRETIEIRRLDDFEIPDGVRHLKLDVQGFEPQALAGAERTLPTIRSIEIELSIRPLYESQMRYLPMLADLEDLGFKLIDLRAGVFDERSRAVELDAFLVRDPAA